MTNETKEFERENVLQGLQVTQDRTIQDKQFNSNDVYNIVEALKFIVEYL